VHYYLFSFLIFSLLATSYR